MSDEQELKLTPKEKRFCEEYIIDLNGTQAAIRAGYSRISAEATASRKLGKDKIRTYIKKLEDERSKRTEISADQVLKELAKIGFADIKDFLAYRTEKTVVDREKDGTPILDYKTVVDLKPSEEIDGHCISEIKQGKDGSFSFKLHCKIPALEMIAKHLGMFIERTENKNENISRIEMNIKNLSVEELRELAKLKKPNR